MSQQPTPLSQRKEPAGQVKSCRVRSRGFDCGRKLLRPESPAAAKPVWSMSKAETTIVDSILERCNDCGWNESLEIVFCCGFPGTVEKKVWQATGGTLY